MPGYTWYTPTTSWAYTIFGQRFIQSTCGGCIWSTLSSVDSLKRRPSSVDPLRPMKFRRGLDISQSVDCIENNKHLERRRALIALKMINTLLRAGVYFLHCNKYPNIYKKPWFSPPPLPERVKNAMFYFRYEEKNTLKKICMINQCESYISFFIVVCCLFAYNGI